MSEMQTQLKEMEQENELLLLQLHQVQEELEYYFVEYSKLKNQPPQPSDALTENDLLSSQLHQVQEELEHYFTEYLKLKEHEGKAPNQLASQVEALVQQRYPQFTTCGTLVLAEGHERQGNMRLNCRLINVKNFNQTWDGFNVIVNDRESLLDIEFHRTAPDNIYPLTKFIQTGSNDITAYSVIAPGTDDGKYIYQQLLPPADQLLLQGIIEELIAKLNTGQFERTAQTAEINAPIWVEKLAQLLRQFKSASLEAHSFAQTQHEQPAQPPVEKTEPIISFGNITLLENYVGTSNNEHLFLQIEDLKYGNQHFPMYRFKLAAKRIKPDVFTEFGSLEFRDLPNGQAPLKTWPPEDKDAYGAKLVLDFPTELEDKHIEALNALETADRQMIKKMLEQLAESFDMINLNSVRLNQGVDAWKRLAGKVVNNF